MIAKGGITMQDYNTIISSIQMRLNGCQTRSVMDRYKIGSGTLNLIMSRCLPVAKSANISYFCN